MASQPDRKSQTIPKSEKYVTKTFWRDSRGCSLSLSPLGFEYFFGYSFCMFFPQAVIFGYSFCMFFPQAVKHLKKMGSMIDQGGNTQKTQRFMGLANWAKLAETPSSYFYWNEIRPIGLDGTDCRTLTSLCFSAPMKQSRLRRPFLLLCPFSWMPTCL